MIYQGLPEQLEEQYPELNFRNHCYLRIALDITLQAKWDTKLKKPAYNYLSTHEYASVLNLLKTYQKNKEVLLQHHVQSLNYRKIWKTQQELPF